MLKYIDLPDAPFDLFSQKGKTLIKKQTIIKETNSVSINSFESRENFETCLHVDLIHTYMIYNNSKHVYHIHSAI